MTYRRCMLAIFVGTATLSIVAGCDKSQPQGMSGDPVRTPAGESPVRQAGYVEQEPTRLNEIESALPIAPHAKQGAARAPLPAATKNALQSASRAQQTRLEVIANNLANVHTTAFKRSRVLLEDASYRAEKVPGILDDAGVPTACGAFIGGGVRVMSVQIDFTPGPLQQTGRELDLAIDGNGFFQVQDAATGSIMYTRSGAFAVNANSQLCLASSHEGRLLVPNITIPIDTIKVSISGDGLVSVAQAGNPALNQVGQLQLAQFANPSGLIPQGECLYAETNASGCATTGNPRSNGLGRLRQGELEGSNVDLPGERAAWREATEMLETLSRLVE